MFGKCTFQRWGQAQDEQAETTSVSPPVNTATEDNNINRLQATTSVAPPEGTSDGDNATFPGTSESSI